MSSPDLTIACNRTVGKRIAANTGLMLGSKVLGVLLGLGSLAIATKTLGVLEFGTLVFLHAYMLFFSEVATFQSWQSIIRFGTDDVRDKNCDRLGRLLNFGFKLDFLAAVSAYLLSLLVFQLVVLFTSQFPGLAEGEGYDVKTLQHYAAIYCVLVLFRQRGTSIGIFRLFDKFTVLAVKSLIMPIGRFAGAVVAALLGAGFEGFVLAWFFGSFCAYIFLPTMALLELKRRQLLPLVLKAKDNFIRPRDGVWPFVLKSNIDSTLAAANLHLPALLVAPVFGPAWVGIYKIAEEVAKLLSEGFVLLDQVIYPELAKMVSEGQADKIVRLVTRAALILLSFGTFMSIAFLFIGPFVLSVITSEDFTPAVPLASLLVPAAALLGTAAPLYPLLYAAHRPERAIYARGFGVFIYIVSFFLFSFTIGKMAPGWAAILGNASAVALLVWLARKTLREKKQSAMKGTTSMRDISPIAAAPSIRFVGETTAKIWGLSLAEWQVRAFKKVGADNISQADNGLVVDRRWILSSELAKAFVNAPCTALVVNGIIIATHGASEKAAQNLIGQAASDVDLSAHDLTAQTPDDLAGSYNKVLRKTEPPYALNADITPIKDIMKRQFSSSYKGITDFVTKFIWPWPAYHVTRACATLRLTPNMVTTIGLVLMFAALYYFWHGQWALGFFTGWIMTFLDTVDGKLARTTMTYSAWGNIYDHGIDLIHPPFWYWAWFMGLGGSFVWQNTLTDPMMFALIAIFIGYVVDRVIEGIFIAQHGFHIHVWRPINSALRFITARRNPNMFIFMIGIIMMPFIPPAGEWGFYAVAIWTWVCVAFNIGVVIVGTLIRKPIESWMDAKA